MLAKKNRLRKKKEFNFIYKKGTPFFTKNLTVYVFKTKNNFSKVGFSVNNKVGNSVIRHKVKRRLSEIVRGRLLQIKTNNYIFVARKGCEELDFNELKGQVESLLKKANLLKNED